MESINGEKLSLLIASTVNILLTILLLSAFSYQEYFYNQELINRIENFEGVFTSEMPSNDFYYYKDFTEIRIFSEDYTTNLNTDVFVLSKPVESYQADELFFINWKFEQIGALSPNEMLVSKNLAVDHGIKIGDFFYVKELVYTIKDFLPSISGIKKIRNREGVVLLGNNIINHQFDEWSFFYFNYDLDSTLVNVDSIIRKKDIFFTNESFNNLIISGYFLFTVIVVSSQYYFSPFIKKKIIVMFREKTIFLEIIKKTYLDTLFFFFLPIIAFNSIHFLSNFNLYYLSALNLSILLILFQILIHLFIFVITYILFKREYKF
jgi:hypothetical protein